LALVEDPDEREQLKQLGHCHQPVHHRSETDAALEMDNAPSMTRYACMHAHSLLLLPP
jgi:hypothetical protein